MTERGLIVGRFQPFHKGHLELIRYALTLSENLSVAIGSVNKHDQDNPLNFDQRLYMVNKVVKREGIVDMVNKVVGIRDYKEDDRWIREVVSRLGEFDVVYGHNEWTNRVMRENGFEVIEGPFEDRERYEGVKIRELIRKGDSEWKSRVPAYLVSDIKKMIS